MASKDDNQEMIWKVVVVVVLILAISYIIYRIYQYYARKQIQQPQRNITLPTNEYGWTVLPDGTKVLI